jgi:hypothetical protein
MPGRTPPPDHYSSATWLQLPRFPDPSILRLIVGTWYTENQSPQTTRSSGSIRPMMPTVSISIATRPAGHGHLLAEPGHGSFRAVPRGQQFHHDQLLGFEPPEPVRQR